MKFFLSTLLLLLTTMSHAKSNLKLYYQEVNEAELSFINDDFKAALAHYQNAFSNKENPFAIDYYNAAVCALKSDDISQSYIYCQHLAEKGVGAAFFQKKSVFNPMKRQAKKWNVLTQDAKATALAWQEKNSALLQRLEALYNRDQKMHIIWGQSDYNNELELQVRDVDDSIANELFQIFQQKGFLSEMNIGVSMKNDTTIAYQPDFYVIMRHNFQGRVRSDTLFAPILRQAVRDGSLRPIVLAEMFGANYHPNLEEFGTNMYFIFKCSLYSFNAFDSSRLKEIEENRKRIYLPSINDLRTKLVYSTNYPESNFRIYVVHNKIGSFGDETSEKNFLKETKKIQALENCY